MSVAVDIGRQAVLEPPDEGDSANLPEVTLRTQALGRRPGNYVAIENTVARSPLILAASGKSAGAAHKAITALWARRYASTGCPSSGCVSVSFTEIGHILGFESMGGWQYQRTRELVGDLQHAFIDPEWLPEGHGKMAAFTLTQGDQLTETAGGMIHVQLSTCFQASIRSGAWTYIDPNEVRRLRAASPRSDTPLLLWLWLQTESLPWASGWRVFNAPDGAPVPDVRCVAERLNLHGTKRRDVVAAIRKAAEVVCEAFTQYTITVASARSGAGMWNLHADRRQEVGQLTPERANTGRPDVRVEDAESYRSGTTGSVESTGNPLHAFGEEADLLTSSPSVSTVSVLPSEKNMTGADAQGDCGKLRESDRAADPRLARSANGRPREEEGWPARPEGCTRERLLDYLDSPAREEERMIRYVANVTSDGVFALAMLATLACETARRESGGGVCAYTASHDWCPVWDALAYKGQKLHNYITRKKKYVADPDAYLRGVFRRARCNPAELLGRTRHDSEEMLAYLRELREVYRIDPTFELPIWTSLRGFDDAVALAAL